MTTYVRLVVLVTAVALSAVAAADAGTQGAADAGTQGAAGQGVSEALAELNALGLRVEIRAAEATAAQSTAAPPTSPSGAGTGFAETAQSRAQESVWDRVRDIFGPVFQRTADRLIEDAIGGIRDACLINLTADDQGFELASVALSLGGVTATFRPSREFCEQVPMTD